VGSRAGGWVAGALAISLFAVGCTQAKKEAPAGIAWNRAYDAALADARANHRPILLDFYTDW
jgi:thiol:disulfide interchange protein